jgi:hypothetical protein
MTGFNQSLTDIFDLQTAERTSEIVNQRYDQNSRSTSLSGRVVYTEPLGGGFFLEANYQYGWNKNTSFKNTFNSATDDLIEDLLVYNGVGEIPDPVYSNSINNTSQNHRAGASFTYQKEKIRAQLCCIQSDHHRQCYIRTRSLP